MSDAAAMRFVERVGNVGAESQYLIEKQGAFFKALGESFSFDAFHYEVVDAVLLADVMQNANVGMVQTGNGFCLALEALAANWV